MKQGIPKVAKLLSQRALMCGLADEVLAGQGRGAVEWVMDEALTNEPLIVATSVEATSVNEALVGLGGVESRYLRETGENVTRLLESADAGGLVLTFDEADALFGKRTEVQDSHDRYANIEVAHVWPPRRKEVGRKEVGRKEDRRKEDD